MDVEKIKSLIESGQTEQAQKELVEFFKASVSESDRAAALVSLASLQMGQDNALNEQYLQILGNAMELLKQENTVGQQLLEKLETEDIRKKISQS
jgi:hypothetical protein